LSSGLQIPSIEPVHPQKKLQDRLQTGFFIMHPLSLAFRALLLSSTAAANVIGNPPDNERANAIKEAFQFAWNGYFEHAFPNDELHPISNTFSNSRNGWGASAVDAMSTALVMEIPDIVDTILNFIPTIDFDFTATQVSLFETNIRYVAGILSAYDLLTGPLSHLASNKTAVDALLRQAERLASNLLFAFDTPSGVPSNNLNLVNRTTDGSTTNDVAQAGTLVLEFTRLSDLTGNQTFAEVAQKAETFILNPQPPENEPFPGLYGNALDLTTGEFVNNIGGWEGGTDSNYEYLIKMFVYDSSRFSLYKDRWALAVDSTIRHLASQPSSRPDLTFLAEFQGQTLIFSSQHLAGFAGGNIILGGSVLKNQTMVDFGLELVNAWVDTYTSDATGIGPEVFNWVATENNDTINPPPPEDQVAFYNKSGFYITDSSYFLRPEVLESIYYAYRITGDQKYRDISWAAFQAINTTCRVGSGYSEVDNVNVKGGGGFTDFQDSFLFAEVFKYSYLIQAAVSLPFSSGISSFRVCKKRFVQFRSKYQTNEITGRPLPG
jgi:mannosyl-oligosaccharide alpha-1,2-mannosidase